jgi:hypothetical protein
VDINKIDGSSSEFSLIVLILVEILPNRGGEEKNDDQIQGRIALSLSKL